MNKQACRFVSLVADDVKANDLFLTSPCGKDIGVIHIKDEKFYFKTLNNGNVTSTYTLSIPPGTNFGEYMFWDNSQNKWRIEGNRVRLGTNAGKNQGEFSIAIGAKAGYPNQGNNSIILNATGQELSGNNSSLYISPIRKEQNSNQTRLSYNPVTKEVTYNDTGLYLSGDSVLPSTAEIELGNSSSYLKTAYLDRIILKDNIFVETSEGLRAWNGSLLTQPIGGGTAGIAGDKIQDGAVTLSKLAPEVQTILNQLQTSFVTMNSYWEKRVLAMEEYIRVLEKTYTIKDSISSIQYTYSGNYQNVLPNNFSIQFGNRIVNGGVTIILDNYTYNAFSKSLSVISNTNQVISTLNKSAFNSVTRTAGVIFAESMLPVSFQLLDLESNILVTRVLTAQEYVSLSFTENTVPIQIPLPF